jgi:AbrB family looped-hinge helix DNA binding protein
MRSFPAKLTSKAQVTLPLEIRKSLGVGPGDGIEFFLHRTGEVFVLPRNRPAAAILGKGAAFARPLTREEGDRLVGKAIAARGKVASPQSSHSRRKAG